MYLRFSPAADHLRPYYLSLNEEAVDILLTAIVRADSIPADTAQRLIKVAGLNLYQSENRPTGRHACAGVFLSDIPAGATASDKTVCIHLGYGPQAAAARLVVIGNADSIDDDFLARAPILTANDAMLLAAAPASMAVLIRRYAKTYPHTCIESLENGVEIRSEDNTPVLAPVLHRLSAADLQPLLHSVDRDIRVRARLLLGKVLLNDSVAPRDRRPPC